MPLPTLHSAKMTVPFLALLAACASSPLEAHPLNLILNPGFESGLAPWTVGGTGTGTVVASEAHSGSAAGRVRGANSNLEQVISGLSPSTSYVLTAWGRVARGGDVLQLGVKDFKDDDTQAWVQVKGTAYEQVTVRFTTGPSSTSALVYAWKASGAGDAFADDYALVREGGPASFVSRAGTEFTLDGNPFRFVGFNLYDAANTSAYHCVWWEPYSEAELDQTLAYARAQAGATVLRFWAFQSYTRGGTDWSGIDRVLRLAKKHGMRVIPVLENNQPHCTQGGPKYENNGSWYANAPRRDFTYGHPLSLPDYIDRIVARYKDEPAIFAWMVMNEAESDNREALFQFAKATTEQVKRLDPNHLVTLGAQSNGVAGVSGADFLRVFALASIDFAEGHDWGYWASEEEALPGSPDGLHLPDPRSAQCLSTAYIPNHPKIACSIAQSLQVLGKPYLMGESGLVADSAETRARRASRLDAKMNAFFLNGGGGYLYWQLNKLVDSEKFDVLTTTNDPLFAVMKKYVTGTASAPPP